LIQYLHVRAAIIEDVDQVAPSLVNDATVMFGRDFTPQKELLEKITMPVLALSGDVDMLPRVDTSFFRTAPRRLRRWYRTENIS
jgi:hypothetical protein